MTGQSNGGPVRLRLRAPPHRPFVQGYPGVAPIDPQTGQPSQEPGAVVRGSIEVRITGQVKAKWIRVEVRKREVVTGPSAPKQASGPNAFDIVGKAHILWKAPEGKEYDAIKDADYGFAIPLDNLIPPSIELRNAHVRYELVGGVSYKSKSGLFKKDHISVATVDEPLQIIKYDLASAWPAFNANQRRSISTCNGAVTLTVERSQQAFGPGEKIYATATIRSELVQAFRVKGFDMALVELFTIYPSLDSGKKKKKDPPPQPVVKRTTLLTCRKVINDVIGRGGEKTAILDILVPQQRLSVKHAKYFKIEYEIVVEAACDGPPGKVMLGGLECVLGSFARASAQQAVKDIEALNPQRQNQASSSGHQSSPSLPGQLYPKRNAPTGPPAGGHQQSASFSGSPGPGHRHASEPYRPQLQPFIARDDQRRLSSETTTTTTTTDYAPSTITTNYRTSAPASSGRPLNFPSPQPSQPPQLPKLAITQATLNGDLDLSSPNHTMVPLAGEDGEEVLNTRRKFGRTNSNSEDSPGASNRLSTHTTGTFGGAWNADLLRRPGDDGLGSPTGPPGSPMLVSPATPTWPSPAADKHRTLEESQSRAAASTEPPGYGPPPPPKDPVFRSTTPASGVTTPQRIVASALPARVASQGAPASPSRTSSRPSSPHSSNAHGSVSSHRTPSQSQPQQRYMTAAEEKERMRYEMAVANRDHAAGSPSQAGPAGGSQAEEPIPYDQIFGGSSSSGPSKPAPAPALNPAYMSAAEEKEMMKKRYEDATQSVARSQLEHDESPSASLNGHSAPGSSKPATGSASGSQAPPAAYMSAEQEKDLMRKRYEAAAQGVARSTASPPASPSPSSPRRAGGSRQPAASSPIAAEYMSAEQEKEMMRRRYEEASQGVSRRVASISTPPQINSPPASSLGHGGPSTSSPLAPEYLTAEQEKEQMRRRYEEASMGVARKTASPPPSSSAFASSNSFPSPASASASKGPSSKAAPPLAQAPEYMSAEQEKEQMRRRYEEASMGVQRKFTSPPSSNIASPPASSVGHGGPSTSSPLAPEYLTAEQEKEQMRRRYEEASMGVQRKFTSPPSSNFASPPPSSHGHGGPSTSSPLAPEYMTAEQEKEQMRRRYEEASMGVQRKTTAPVNEFGVASGSGAGSSSAPPLAQAPEYMSAEQEKEQMRRRYEEASMGVARKATSPPPAASGSGSAGASSGAPIAQEYMSAEQEKEMMRRRYEDASHGVARRQATLSSPPESPPLHSAPKAAAAVPAAYMSAEQEKAQMRQRYESARGAESRAVGDDGAGSSGGVYTDEPISYDDLFGSEPAGGSSSSAAVAGPSAPSAAAPYMSAAEEKDMMKRRFEAATQGVAARRAGSASPASQHAESTGSRTTSPASQSKHNTGYMSAEDEKATMRRRFEAAQDAVQQRFGSASPSPTTSLGAAAAAVSPSAARGPRQSSLRSMSVLPDGPPPPLAPRPPRDYIEML